MKVLVTGGAGFIGSHLTERLLVRGDEVVVLDNFDGFYGRDVKERNLEVARGSDGFTLVEGDIRDRECLDALPDFDVVVHLAALAGVRPSIARPAEYYDVNVSGTVQLLECVRSRDVGRFIFGSSSSVYGNNKKVPFSEDDPVGHPISPYASTKKAGELACHAYHHLNDIGMVCLRFFTVYGPRQRPDLAIHKFTRLMLVGEPIPMFGDGSTERDYTFVEDILSGVEGAMGLLERSPESFEVINLGESETISLSRMIRTIADTLGMNPTIEALPPQPGDMDRTFADVSKARALIDYDPSTPFEEGIETFVSWFRGVQSSR